MIVRARCQSFCLVKADITGKVATPKYLPSHVNSSKMPSYHAVDTSPQVNHVLLSAAFF